MTITVPDDAYCALTAVRQLSPQRVYDANSKPTATQVENLIRDVAAEINGVLEGLGYEVPVAAAADAGRVLGHLNALEAASLAEEATFSVGDPNESGHARALHARYREKLELLATGRIALPGAVRAGDRRVTEQDRKPSGFPLDADEPGHPRLFTLGATF